LNYAVKYKAVFYLEVLI